MLVNTKTVEERIDRLNNTSDMLFDHLSKHKNGDVTSESCGPIGYIGIAIAKSEKAAFDMQRHTTSAK
jgi:16S rRNA G1207 methylase RsmC